MTNPEEGAGMDTRISEFAGFVREERVSERSLINLLEEILEIIKTGQAIKASERWGFDFKGLWPFDVLAALEEVRVVVGKLRFSDEIGVSGVGIGVLGERD